MSRASVSIASTCSAIASRATSSCRRARGERGAVAERARHRDRVRAHGRAADVLAADLERAGEAGEHADAQLRRLVAERGGRPLEQLDRDAGR